MPNLPRPLVLLAVAAGFAAAHTQGPLFYSNRNQYLLHGLAAAGYGNLDRDWLANTKDPTPLFSSGVEWAYRVGGLWPLQAAFFALLMGYFLAAWWLVTGLFGAGFVGWAPPTTAVHGGRCPPYETNQRQLALLGFAALFTVAHAAVVRLGSVWLTGVDYPWYLQAGVAAQYVLGPGLQPSAFGVLLVASLAAFANARLVLAAALAGAAGLVHATYLLPAALLTAGYTTRLVLDGRTRAAVSVGAVSLLVAAPAVAYTLVTFPPTSAGAFAESQRILAEVRIPHHAVVARWFDAVAALQVVWIVIGIAAARRTPLFLPLVVAAAGALVLTLVQVATGDHTLALLFPWRLSTVLVPVATAVLAAKLVAWLPQTRFAPWVFAAVFAGAAVGGVVVTAGGLGYAMNEAERPVLDYVRDHAGPGDVYLIPTRFPAVGSGRGAVSNTFAPAPRPKPGSNQIPVDLQRFRLATGVPIFADFKAVPYADVEVLEWHRRVRQAEAWYDRTEWDEGVREGLRREGITHVVTPRHQTIRAGFLETVYADEAYTVFRVN